MAVTVTDNSVLAVLGQSDPRSQLFLQGGARESRLVCLDRASGKERWSFSARALAEDRSNARSMELAGTPLLVMEAMKMEHTLTAPARGRLQAFRFAVGDQVSDGAELVDFAAEAAEAAGTGAAA